MSVETLTAAFRAETPEDATELARLWLEGEPSVEEFSTKEPEAAANGLAGHFIVRCVVIFR